jgi:hypothetical protein
MVSGMGILIEIFFQQTIIIVRKPFPLYCEFGIRYQIQSNKISRLNNQTRAGEETIDL